MPTVTIHLGEARADDLPPLCMVCGDHADLHKSRTFSWRPGWTPLLIPLLLFPYLIVSLILTKRGRVEVPLCRAHTWHWAWRAWATVLGFAGLVAFALVGGVLVSQPNLLAYTWAFMLACVGGFVAWAVGSTALRVSGVRPVEITDDYARLRGVSGAFAEAHEEMEDAREAAYRARRAARRRRRETDD